MTRFLTIEKAAARVDRSERTIKRWGESGLTITAGMVREDALLEMDRRMRERRGRPKGAPSALDLIVAERARQDAKWGEQNHTDGTGPQADVLGLLGELWHAEAADIAERAKLATDAAFAGREERPGCWADILLEEVFEALAENDPEKLRTELVQVAAVAAQWVEAIARRTHHDRKAPISETGEN